MTKISILGCGWLGFPLAKALLKDGFTVKGSTTSTEKLAVLEHAGIQALQVMLDSESVSGPIEELLVESTILIIDIPPKLRGDQSGNFVGKIKTLLPFIEKSMRNKSLLSIRALSNKFSTLLLNIFIIKRDWKREYSIIVG